MIISRGKLIKMLREMAKENIITVEAQLLITDRLIHSTELAPDEEELEVLGL